MVRDQAKLRRALSKAGYSASLLDAALLPDWARDDSSGEDDHLPLRRALTNRLGIRDNAIQGERIDFVWNDDALFKTLGKADPIERLILASFSAATARLVEGLVTTPIPDRWPSAQELRTAILTSRPWVDLSGLLSASWALGIPVLHLRLFPLSRKAMHAVAAQGEERTVIMLGRDARYPAPIAFTLAHELGHVMLGHLGRHGARIELDDEDAFRDSPLEAEANRFALELLTGSAHPVIEPGRKRFNSRMLAQAVLAAAGPNRIEPGTLALVTGHQTGQWAQANAALELIYDQPGEVWRSVNAVAAHQLGRTTQSGELQYLARLLGRDTLAQSSVQA